MSPLAKRRLAFWNVAGALLGLPVISGCWFFHLLTTEQLVGITLLLSLLTHAISSLDAYFTADVRVQQEGQTNGTSCGCDSGSRQSP